MPWGAAIGAIGSVASAAMSDSGGGAGSSTASKEPWADAAPWLRENIKTGQGLQSQYTAQPFNAQQLAAYANMGRQTGYMNNVVPDLLGQISNQNVGFDRSNTNGRVNPYTFNGSGSGATGGAQSGLLGQLSNPATAGQYTSAANPPAAAPAAASPFTQQESWNRSDAPGGAIIATPDSLRQLNGMGIDDSGLGAIKSLGSYGSFKYGDQPQRGTQQWRDMSEYLAMGGQDPAGYLGRLSSGAAPKLRGSGSNEN